LRKKILGKKEARNEKHNYRFIKKESQPMTGRKSKGLYRK